MCSIANGFRERAVSLHSCKTVDKEIRRIVSNIGIYCSSDKVGADYPVQCIFENSPATSMHFATRVRTWRVARLNASWLPFMLTRSSNSSCVSTLQQPTDASHRFTCFIQWRSTAGLKDNFGRQIQTPVQWNSSISKTARNRTHAHLQLFA
jgi:hypothetical protein